MLENKINRMKNGKGFIAALDQSGGSTPKALALYGVHEDAYHSDDEMFQLVHKMRSRIIEASVFRSERILGAILFEDTMERKIAGKYTADYLLDEKEILPFLKVDKGLQETSQGVQLMNEMPDLETLLTRANERNIFGTKMRSVIHEANANGIRAVVEQQFVEAKRISSFDLVPIVEPEVNIESPEKAEIENILLEELEGAVKQLAPDEKIILKLSIPSRENLYKPLIDHPNVLRVVALSGGYTADKANELLAKNNGMIASFSRALAQDLRVDQTDEEFEGILGKAIDEIYEASIK